MTREVPFLTRQQIEDEARDLLSAYGSKYGVVEKPPIPADEILNTYLKVALDFDDLPKLLNMEADVFGATWLERRQVIIDQRLDPTNHPEMIGRYNFTVGHETGHWQLHRGHFEKDPNQQQLFAANESPTVVCRSSEAKERIEWQADVFSSCLLMPRSLIKECFRIIYAWDQISLVEIKQRIRDAGIRNSVSDDLLIEKFAKPIARAFLVSPIAMRIRLEDLGLVVRKVEPRLVGL